MTLTNFHFSAISYGPYATSVQFGTDWRTTRYDIWDIRSKKIFLKAVKSRHCRSVFLDFLFYRTFTEIIVFSTKTLKITGKNRKTGLAATHSLKSYIMALNLKIIVHTSTDFTERKYPLKKNNQLLNRTQLWQNHAPIFIDKKWATLTSWDKNNLSRSLNAFCDWIFSLSF
jgi:hypothetical protein